MTVVSLLLALLGCGTSAEAPPPPAPARPNVLIVLWDTVRADRLSLYGYGRDTTPELARFAAEATVFEAAWSPGTWTVPAHGSIFTGLPTATHGASGEHRWLDERHWTLAELLGAQGYDTVAFSANVYVGTVANLLQGFDTVHTTYPHKGDRNGRYVAAALEASKAKVIPGDASTELSPSFRGSPAEKWDKAIYKDAAPVLVRGLFEHLDERTDDRPWFAYLNFMEAHSPRLASAASREHLLTEAERTQALNTDMSLFAENSWMVGQREYSEAELAAFGNVYDASVRDLDDATGVLFAELERRGLLENTVVVVLSDHGESLGEHRMLEHRWSIHEPLVHVPFAIRYPAGGFGAARVAQPVSTIDLFATVLDLTGVAPPEVPGLDSRSLRDLSGREVIISELVHAYAAQLRPVHRAYPSLDLSSWKRTYSAAREGSLKLVQPYPGGSELYDLAADPGELHDLATQRPGDRTRLETVIRAWREARTPYEPSGEGDEEISAVEAAQLEILGYLDKEEP